MRSDGTITSDRPLRIDHFGQTTNRTYRMPYVATVPYEYRTSVSMLLSSTVVARTYGTRTVLVRIRSVAALAPYEYSAARDCTYRTI